MRMHALLLATAAITFVAAHPGGAQTAAPDPGYSPNPQLSAPEKHLIPTVNIARVERWAPGEKPVAAQGFTVTECATDLDHPRWLYVLPSGDVLVAETNAPPKETTGLKDFAMKPVQKVACAGTQSPDRITLLRDADKGGKPETRSEFLTGLFSPFGMALVGNDFYVANADAVLRFPYQSGEIAITAPGTKLTDLPGGPINHHWTKSLVASPDGSKLYVAVGSNSNAAENGFEAEDRRPAILEIDRASGESRVFASGRRNPVAWQPESSDLW